MALDFPTSPTNGQIYNNYYWDNTNSVWRLLGDSLEVAADFSNTATGTYTDGFDYKAVIFKANGTLTITRGGYADVLVVGGGGGGGGAEYAGGGGGAGGFIYKENVYLPVGSHSVVVGDGGVSVAEDPSAAQESFLRRNGAHGRASSLLGYTAAGGGAGDLGYSGYAGASGGGGGYSTISSQRAIAVSGQGNEGGTADGNSGSPYPGGGGGGAGQQGTHATSTTAPGNGGDGSVSDIIPTSLATSESVGEVSGSDVYFSGGGAGGARGGQSGTGGLGGGGASRANGAANTGGGGAGNNSNNGNTPGNGGSGIVIVRVRTNS